MSLLVTVGTTEFDQLIKTIDDNCDEFLRIIKGQGIARVILQIGRGSYTPVKITSKAQELGGIDVSHFRFCDSLSGFMSSAQLVISHAGAGSILESLRSKRQLVVVINEALMDNHQVELADALASQRYLAKATCSSLISTLASLSASQFVPFPESNRAAFCSLLDREFGFC